MEMLLRDKVAMIEKSKGEIVFFDDDASKKRKLERYIPAKTGCQLDFISLQGEDVFETVETKLQSIEDEPDIVLMDQDLSHTKTSSKRLTQNGTGLVPILREHWPKPPVICVTAVPAWKMGELLKDLYEEVVAYEDLPSFADYIPSLLRGYEKLRVEVTSICELMGVLHAPASDREGIREVLPREVKTDISTDGRIDEHSRHILYRWFRREFYARPGFLLDGDWTSLLLGIAPEYLPQYKGHIREALYTGIFKNEARSRWWKSLLYQCLLPSDERRLSESLHRIAKQELEIPDQHASRCSVCDEKWPEVMGLPDSSSPPEPMHRGCTKPDPNYTIDKPFYEQTRIMREEAK